LKDEQRGDDQCPRVLAEDDTIAASSIHGMGCPELAQRAALSQAPILSASLEVRQRGYTGNRATVQHCVVRLLSPQGKPSLVQIPVRTMPCPSARRAFGWLVGWRKLTGNEPQNVDHERFTQALCQIETVVAEVRSLAREFLGLMHRRRPREFDRWLKRLSNCSAPEMRSFAASLRSDLPAVRAAFTLRWSNGQTEGHVNRLKFLKRQMYGRASVELLRLRVLRPN